MPSDDRQAGNRHILGRFRLKSGMPVTPIDDDAYLRPLANWCKQSVLFALMVRARDLGKPLPDEFMNHALEYAAEVYQKVLAH